MKYYNFYNGQNFIELVQWKMSFNEVCHFLWDNYISDAHLLAHKNNNFWSQMSLIRFNLIRF